MSRGRLPVLLALSLLGSAFSVPTEWRVRRGYGNNELDSKLGGYKDLVAASSENRKVRQDDDDPNKNNTLPEEAKIETEPARVNLHSTEESKTSYPPPSPYDDDDDSDEDDELHVTQPSGGGGSSIFSLLKLANALFPGSSTSNIRIRNVIRKFLIRYQDVLRISRRPDYVSHTKFMRRIDTSTNEIDDSYIADLKPPPFQKQEIEDSSSDENDTESDEDTDEEDDDDDDSKETNEDQGNAAEESVENNNKGSEKESKPKQETSNGDDDDDDNDYSEEPEGDGQGGGILGLLAGLSGGGDGSDLGSLLAAVSGIVVNLSSEGEENPGAVIASYLLTSLDTLTGGGAQNNGAFFGNFLSKLIKGTSAAPENSAEEGGNKEPIADSGGFLLSFLMGLLGDLSKGSSGGSSHR